MEGNSSVVWLRCCFRLLVQYAVERLFRGHGALKEDMSSEIERRRPVPANTKHSNIERKVLHMIETENIDINYHR